MFVFPNLQTFKEDHQDHEINSFIFTTDLDSLRRDYFREYDQPAGAIVANENCIIPDQTKAVIFILDWSNPIAAKTLLHQTLRFSGKRVFIYEDHRCESIVREDFIKWIDISGNVGILQPCGKKRS
jgi:hypothetical protein